MESRPNSDPNRNPTRDLESSYLQFLKQPMGHRKKTAAVDRISELPDHILVHILSLLPIEDAIKTELLSRRWQFLWTHLPSLLFHYRDDGSAYDSESDNDSESTNDSESDNNEDEKIVRDFVAFVDETLILCNCSKLKKFGVDFAYEPGFAPNVNRWTRFAAGKGTEELHLEFWGTEDDVDILNSYELPQLLYTNSSFRKLRFSWCSVVPKGLVAWNSLRELSIGYVKLSDDVIQKILEGSPSLEIFDLYWFFGFNRLHVSNASVKKLILREYWHYGEGTVSQQDSVLEISGPNLQSLLISGCLEIVNLRLGDVSSLVDATLNCNFTSFSDDNINDYGRYRNMLRGLLESLGHVKNITLGTWAIQVLSIMEAKGLRAPLLRCECLVLDTVLHKSVLRGIANLLESSPGMETLVITTSSSSNSEYFGDKSHTHFNFEEMHYWASRKTAFNCLYLKKIEFAGLRWYSYDSDFSFVQFLLKNARALQKMLINTPNEDGKTPMEFFQAAQKLLSFPRSSPDAVVMFY